MTRLHLKALACVAAFAVASCADAPERSPDLMLSLGALDRVATTADGDVYAGFSGSSSLNAVGVVFRVRAGVLHLDVLVESGRALTADDYPQCVVARLPANLARLPLASADKHDQSLARPESKCKRVPLIDVADVDRSRLSTR